MTYGNLKSLSVSTGDSLKAFTTVPAGYAWTLLNVTAANQNATANSTFLQYIDASASNAVVNLANALTLGASGVVQQLTAKQVLEAGDILSAKCTTSIYGTKSATMTVSTTARALAYDGTSKLCVVGAASRIHVSSDMGLTWTYTDIGGNKTLSICAFGAGLFITHDGTNFFSSPDGVTWTSRTAVTKVFVKCIFVTSLTLFVAVSTAAGATGIYTSPDGITWTARSAGTAAAFADISFDGTTLLAVGAVDPTNGLSCTSTNGTTWTAQNSGTAVSFATCTWVSGFSAFMVTSGSSSYSTTDGITYTAQQTTGSTVIASASNGSEIAYFYSAVVSTLGIKTGSTVAKTHNGAPAFTAAVIYAAGKYINCFQAFTYTSTTFTATDANTVIFTASILETPV